MDWKNLTTTFTVEVGGAVKVTFAGAPEGKKPELRLTNAEREQALKTLAVVPVPAPPSKELGLALTASGEQVEVTSLPADATGADFAFCTTAEGANPVYSPKGIQVGGTAKPPDATHVYADAHPNAGASEGTWWSKAHGRIKVALAPVEPPVEPPPHKEEPPVEPPPVSTGFKRGMNAGGWSQSQEVADAKKLGSDPVVRLEDPSSTTPFTSAGIAVIYLNSGGTSTSLTSHFTPGAREYRSKVQQFGLGQIDPGKFGYSSGGVKSLNATTVAADAVAVLKKHPDVWAYELLNEPGGNWFWGEGAESEANAAAYCKLIRAVYEAMKTGGVLRPLLVSFDGGHAGDNTWGKHMLAADPTLFELPEVIPTNHPYDGSSANPSSTLVRWGSVEETPRLTGKWPAITEYGRPLETSTGDSPKSTEAQQAAADGAMVKKGREAGCPAVTIFGYRAGNYGIFSSGDTALLAVAAIADA